MLGGGGRRPHVAATLRPKISWIFGNLEELRQAEAGMASGLRYPGKVVIVTGGTRGIGEGIMREFGERGQALQRELKDSGSPGEGRFQVCDVLSEMDIKNLVSVTIEHYGRLDCLVNNAGWHPPEQQMDDVTAQEFRHLIDLNVVSCFLMAKYALPYLRKTKGNLINISSLVSIMGQKYAVPYVATKGAVSAMTKAMAVDESKHGVRVNSILPGNIWTPMWEKAASHTANPEATIQEGKNAQLLGRMGTPAECAAAALYLASDATFCTGIDLVLSGGAELGYAQKKWMESSSDFES
ncbi:17-beta-hydroxysteroid dehydrogenase 14 isoform X2 [Hemicordylus capensis]|uniref:17-beta-hydroxysteroid dehydrogenase 14 isoform X2 n=1 Tax=Hemicordylus capensis TaxID=884348 RepID=UPI002302AA69|nr:17-beta-hydroxysteroid dehydrogenase 14 isoform X2 [Hemicordylus capensis]